MTCDGCANAARKVLSKLGGKSIFDDATFQNDIQDVQISVQNQRVVVTTTLPADSILAALQKTGKKCKQIFHFLLLNCSLSEFLLLYSTVLYLYHPVLYNYISVLEEENRIFVQFIIISIKVLI
ncbi:unnamed protein product [Wuchereria bancrofti]|uniref:Copper transport protein ATOX1 n=1 Tax=Wuchereria bancrofti TaxID=6293 RepID=A0A3P7DAE3_WUCBA|nr:unnamed protein product [Wuchereria bancrofti]